eukprot:RCo042699
MAEGLTSLDADFFKGGGSESEEVAPKPRAGRGLGRASAAADQSKPAAALGRPSEADALKSMFGFDTPATVTAPRSARKGSAAPVAAPLSPTSDEDSDDLLPGLGKAPAAKWGKEAAVTPTASAKASPAAPTPAAKPRPGRPNSSWDMNLPPPRREPQEKTAELSRKPSEGLDRAGRALSLALGGSTSGGSKTSVVPETARGRGEEEPFVDARRKPSTAATELPWEKARSTEAEKDRALETQRALADAEARRKAQEQAAAEEAARLKRLEEEELELARRRREQEELEAVRRRRELE